ncbi:MAG: methionyl-tRNA formyltransferase [Sulfuricella sp.]|nr:methionyl-tRNA formyltransferase [Sulfuricella sp.]
MNILFAGTPEFAASALRALIAAGHVVSLVLTQPDRPAGRGMKLTPSPVKQVALAHGLNILQSPTLKEAAIQRELAAVDAEVMIVAAYGLILPKAVLDIPPRGCLNIHASLLPRWRGAAPIQRAILAGDEQTGVTIMQMDVGLDTGDMLLKEALPIDCGDTAQTLHDKLAEQGARLIVAALGKLEKGGLVPEKQDEVLANYAAKLTKEEAFLDWSQTATRLSLAVRAYNPFPVAQARIRGETWRIWQAQPVTTEGGHRPGQVLGADRHGILIGCGTGVLRITELQKAGGKRMPVGDFLAGNSLQVGECFEI